MGYTTLLDIVGSVIIGGLLLVILLRTNSNAAENSYNFNGDVVVQQSLDTLLNNSIDPDFRKIGYTTDGALGNNAITTADSSNIIFQSDINNDSTISTVRYYLGPKSELSGTINPNDMILYRVVTTVGAVITWRYPGVTIFKLIYLDKNNNVLNYPVALISQIVKIQIYLKMESAVPYKGNYVSAYWNGIKSIAVNVNR